MNLKNCRNVETRFLSQFPFPFPKKKKSYSVSVSPKIMFPFLFVASVSLNFAFLGVSQKRFRSVSATLEWTIVCISYKHWNYSVYSFSSFSP